MVNMNSVEISFKNMNFNISRGKILMSKWILSKLGKALKQLLFPFIFLAYIQLI